MAIRHTSDYGWLEAEPIDTELKTTTRSNIQQSDLSEDQAKAYSQIKTWLEGGCDLLTLGGYAGTGKTTLVSLIASSGGLRIAFCAYTGKAANVLAQKLRAAGVAAHYCGTIHRLIYIPVADEKTGAITSWTSVESLDDYDLIVVDEASMVDETMFSDLQKYSVPILAVGDHGQLPPVKGQFSLMTNPDVRLEKIHRQAADNPIIRLSVAIREQGVMALRGVAWQGLHNITQEFAKFFRDEDKALSTAVLCFTNKKRNVLNASIRRNVFETEPSTDLLRPADVVVCLRNTKFKSEYVFNGMRGKVVRAKLGSPAVAAGGCDFGDNALDSVFEKAMGGSTRFRARVEFPDDRLLLDAFVNRSQFGREKTIASFADAGLPERSHWPEVGMLFDYGYCLTAHKSQGSEFSEVAVVLENMSYMSEDFQRRWIYTAVTRASKNLYLVQG